MKRQDKSPITRWATTQVQSDFLVHFADFDMILDPNDVGFTPLVQTNKVWEKKSTIQIKKMVELGDTFIDCGAHWGYYSCLASKLVGQKGTVYAFEPNLTNFFGLTMNICLNNLNNVKPIPLAVWNQSGVLEFRLESPTIGHVIDEWKPWSRGLRMSACALDELFKPDEVDFIKIDCEGSDSVIVRGAMKILTEGHPKLMIENPPTTILESLGYKIMARFPESTEQTWFFEKQ